MTDREKALNRICRDCGSLILIAGGRGRPPVRCRVCENSLFWGGIAKRKDSPKRKRGKHEIEA